MRRNTIVEESRAMNRGRNDCYFLGKGTDWKAINCEITA